MDIAAIIVRLLFGVWILCLLICAISLIRFSLKYSKNDLTSIHYSNYILLLVSVLLMYENLFHAISMSINDGETLKQLSISRYYIHVFGVPPLLLVIYEIMYRSVVVRVFYSSKFTRKARVVVCVLVALIMAFGIIENTVSISSGSMEYKTETGTQKYIFSSFSYFLLCTFFVIAVSLVAGFLIWRKYNWRWPYLFLATILLVLLNGGGQAVPEYLTLLANLGEVLWLASLVLTEWKTQIEVTKEVFALIEYAPSYSLDVSSAQE